MATLQMNFLSMKLGMQTNVTVFLPSFSPSEELAEKTSAQVYPKDKKFPVLWLLPDETGDDSQWLRESAITRTAQKYGFAVVMPCPFEKLYSEEDPGQKFTSYITEELWYVCTGMFPISKRFDENFIAGAGLGAYGALKCALACPVQYKAVVMLGGAYEKDIKGGYFEALKKQMAKTGLIPPLALDDAPADDAELTVKAKAITDRLAVTKAPSLPDVWITYAKGSPLADYAKRAAENLKKDHFWITEEAPAEGPDDWDFRDAAMKKAAEWMFGKEAK